MKTLILVFTLGALFTFPLSSVGLAAESGAHAGRVDLAECLSCLRGGDKAACESALQRMDLGGADIASFMEASPDHLDAIITAARDSSGAKRKLAITLLGQVRGYRANTALVDLIAAHEETAPDDLLAALGGVRYCTGDRG